MYRTIRRGKKRKGWSFQNGKRILQFVKEDQDLILADKMQSHISYLLLTQISVIATLFLHDDSQKNAMNL